MTKKLLAGLLSGLLTISLVTAIRPIVYAQTNRLLITEIKLGGGNDPKEFVEIFNDTSSPIDLSSYVIEYAKAGFSSSSCSAFNWKAVASPSTLVNTKTLTGTLAPAAFATVEISMNDNAAGAVHLVNTGSMVELDRVGWDEAAPCFRDSPAILPANGQSLKRAFDQPGSPVVSSPDSNSADFSVNDSPSPGSEPCLPNDCGPVIPEDDPEPIEVLEVEITELLPDPASPKLDSQDEYIELHNPNDFPVDLSGYTLHSGSMSSASEFDLNGVTLLANEYRAFYSSLTGLGLVNGSSGQAWLVSSHFVRVSETPWYPAAMGEDKVWALIDGTWQVSDVLSPGVANPLPEPAEQSPVEATPSAEDEEPAPCPAGKFRNPATNRCKTIEEPDEPAACGPGQERNPETNRCRKIVTQTAALAPCAEGQERNPETSRCRKITAETTSLADCQVGYERNPETNRCRKITAVKGATTAVTETATRSKLNYWLICGVSLLVFTYAVYEYRNDLSGAYIKIKSSIRRG